MISKRNFALGIVLLMFAMGGLWLFRLYRQPLGPALDLPTVTEMRPTRTSLSVGDEAVPIASTAASPSTATSTPQPLCGAPPTMDILAVGSDARGDHYLYGLADVIRLVHVDFVNKHVGILEIPRDLWVEIPGISDHYGITEGKLNQAYLYGNKGFGYYDGQSEGPGLLAETLNLNYGVQLDHYLAVNMITFENIVNAVDGIDVYLPNEISVRSKDNPKGFAIPPGQHHIDGETALWIARIRQYHTFGRAENQNIVMCALREKILSPAVLPAIPELVTTFQRYVQTDLSPEQINQLACLATRMNGSDVTFAGFPIETFNNAKKFDPQLKNTTSILEADNDVLRDYIERFQQGIWPAPVEFDPELVTDIGLTCGN